MKRSAIARKTPLRAHHAIGDGKPRKALRRARKAAPMTKAQVARVLAVKALGCLACRHNETIGLQATGLPVEGHHLLSGGRRIGHDALIGLCSHHHQGMPMPGLGCNGTAAIAGPSLARQKRLFVATYGSEADLLARQERLLAMTMPGSAPK